MGFQTIVNREPAPAVEGQFASTNPRGSMLAGVGSLIAGAAGVNTGKFARARNDNGQVSNADPGVASRIGFVHRDQPVLITAWLGQVSTLVTSGLEVTLFDSGDFWARFAAGATVGNKVYASYADGSAVSAPTATPPSATVTGNTTNASTTLTLTAGTLVAGQPISGTNIPANAYIAAVLSSTTYTMSAAATGTATGTTVTGLTAVETRWYVDSLAAAGELAKISTRG